MGLMSFGDKEWKETPFTEEGTCPHCECYVDKRCTSKDYCVIKETKLMQDKDKAKLIFGLHLKLGDARPLSPGSGYYNSEQFMNGIQYIGPLNMEESERIAWSYPNYELAVLFHNGDFVIFCTEGGDFRISRIAGSMERAQILRDIEESAGNMETHWDRMDDIFIPDTKGVWGAPL